MNKTKLSRRCSDCKRLIREHNKSGLCQYHLIRKKKRKHDKQGSKG